MLKVITIATSLGALLIAAKEATAFTQQTHFGLTSQQQQQINSPSHQLFSSFDEDFVQETPEQTRQRIQDLVDENPVLLFMKGSKIFPQCGFSSTAVQILNTFGIDFQSGTNMMIFNNPQALKVFDSFIALSFFILSFSLVDVLADEAVRQGVKEFSQWPTIPQVSIFCSFVLRIIASCY